LTVLLCGGLLLIWKLASAAPPVANDAKTNKDATASEDRATKSNKKTRSADKTAGKDDDPKPEKVVKTDAEWRKILTPMQFKVTRKKFTEQAGTGRYAHWKKDGIYHCVCCGEPLFDSKTKFESGTGWPSFFQAINEEAITELEDTSDGVVRTEVQCSRCDAHLGHVFADGPGPTGLRFCMNSAALKFVDRHKEHAGKDVKSVQHHGVTTGGATTGAEGKAKESKNLE
jgi:peptide-methionine (R)-S-oxide reductase